VVLPGPENLAYGISEMHKRHQYRRQPAPVLVGNQCDFFELKPNPNPMQNELVDSP
jgi:hypothetical protein